MIEVIGLHHISINVTDLLRAKHFYGEVLGLEEIARPGFDFAGAWYRLGSSQLHLIVHDGARTLRHTQDVDSRDGHFALRVSGWTESLAHLRQLGVRAVEKFENRTDWAQVFITDPDGNIIELNSPRQ